MKKIDVNADILRIIAFTFVILVHFLLNSGFYSIKVKGSTMLILNCGRALFMTCVPLFLILSGYLLNKREYNKKHYIGLVKIIVTYIIISIVCLVLLTIINGSDILPWYRYILKILSFDAAPYSWYVNMYIGLYIVIPFLNVLWNNLKNKEQKRGLLICLFILIVLPSVINIFRLGDINWWITPSISKSYTQIVPNWWSGVGYPIIYYFLGCYLKEYKIKITILNNFILIILLTIIFGLFNYYRYRGVVFVTGIVTNYYSFETFVLSLLVANICLKFKIKKRSILTKIKIQKIIHKVSELTFGAYLLSKISDVFFYNILLENTANLKERLIYFIPITAIVWTTSLIMSYMVNVVALPISEKIKKILT